MKPEVTIKDLDVLLYDCMATKELHKEMKEKAGAIWHSYEEQYSKIIAILENEDRDSYRSDDVSFSYKIVEGYKVPKDSESRELFFQYLKDREVYENLVTVNSRSLNSFAQQESELQEQQGNYDFQIPGIIKSEGYHSPNIKRIRK